MTHLKIFLLLIVCAFSAQAANAQNSKTTVDELNGKRIGVIGDSYVRNHKEPFENTWHYKFAKKHGMEYFNYGKNRLFQSALGESNVSSVCRNGGQP